MTATVTINNPQGNQATVIVHESYEETGFEGTTKYTVASGESRTFSVYPLKTLSISEEPWNNKATT